MITLGNKSCPNRSCLNPLTHPLPLLNKPLLATCHILFLTCPIPLPNTTHYNLASQGIYTSKINILCLFCICLDLCLVIVLPLSCPCLVPYPLPLLPPLKPGPSLVPNLVPLPPETWSSTLKPCVLFLGFLCVRSQSRRFGGCPIHLDHYKVADTCI